MLVIMHLKSSNSKKFHSMQLSFDDVCYQSSVIDRVQVDEIEGGLYVLMPKYLKRVKKLLKEALRIENVDYLPPGLQKFISCFLLTVSFLNNLRGFDPLWLLELNTNI